MQYSVKKIGNYTYLRARIRDENGKYKDVVERLPDDFESLSVSEQEKFKRKASRKLDKKIISFSSPEAQKKRAEKESRMNAKNYTVIDLVDDYIKSRWQDVHTGKIKQSYYDCLGYRRNTIASFPLANIELNRLKPSDISQYVYDRVKGDFRHSVSGNKLSGVKPATLEADAKVLAYAFNMAHRKNLLMPVSFENEGFLTYDSIVYILFSKKRVTQVIQRVRPNEKKPKRSQNHALSRKEFIAIRHEVFRPNCPEITFQSIYMDTLKEMESDGRISHEDAYYLKTYRFQMLESHIERLRLKVGNEAIAKLQLTVELVERQAIDNTLSAKIPGTDYYLPLRRYYAIDGKLYSEYAVETDENDQPIKNEYGRHVPFFKEFRHGNPVYNGKELTPDHVVVIHTGSDWYYSTRKKSLSPFIILFVMNTGYRINEAISIKAGDIYYDEETAHYFCHLEKFSKRVIKRDRKGRPQTDKAGKYIRQPSLDRLKTESSVRDVPLNASAMKALELAFSINGLSLAPENADKYVFSKQGKNGKYILPTCNNVLEALKRMGHHARLEDFDTFTMHGLRHTVATLGVNTGGTSAIKSVQSIMGHKHADITMDIYNDEDAHITASIVDALDNIK